MASFPSPSTYALFPAAPGRQRTKHLEQQRGWSEWLVGRSAGSDTEMTSCPNEASDRRSRDWKGTGS